MGSRTVTRVPTTGPRMNIGTDMPTSSNTGTIAGTSFSVINGNVTMSAGQTIQDTIINGHVIVNAANCSLLNCKILGTNAAPASSDNLITVTGASASNLLVQDCEITPQFPHYRWGDGIVGANFTARRCWIHHTTDGIGVFNNNVTAPYATNVTIEGCLIEDLSLWTATTNGVVHPSDTYTHNDCIQHQGGYGTTIFGNKLMGWYAKQYGHWVTTTTTEPYTSVAQGTLSDGGPFQPIKDRGTGTEATGRYNKNISAIMVNQNVGDSYNFTITDNWLGGGDFCINAGGVTQAGTENFGSVLRNRFVDHAQGTQGAGGDDTYTVYVGAGWSGHITTGAGTSDKNYYLDNSNEIHFRVQS